jgi:hypothetical protein
MLRAVGAYVDVKAPDGFNLLEVRDGFWLALERGDAEPLVEEHYLEKQLLMDQAQQLVKDRGGAGNRQPLIRSVAPREGRYQDLLRALGYQLDRSGGHQLLLSAARDRIFVTYNATSSPGGKQMALLGRADIDRVLEAARARRRAEQP